MFLSVGGDKLEGELGMAKWKACMPGLDSGEGPIPILERELERQHGSGPIESEVTIMPTIRIDQVRRLLVLGVAVMIVVVVVVAVVVMTVVYEFQQLIGHLRLCQVGRVCCHVRVQNRSTMVGIAVIAAGSGLFVNTCSGLFVK